MGNQIGKRGKSVLFELRNALRAGDIWLADSRRYREISTALVPIETVSETARLAVPLEAEDWLRHRTHTLKRNMAQISGADQAGCRARLETMKVCRPFGSRTSALPIARSIRQHIEITKFHASLYDNSSSNEPLNGSENSPMISMPRIR